MPLLSIVLVVHREQGFVRACLRSILDQSGDDLEVVVVDDASPDHSAEIIAEVAAADDRLRVHRLADRHGPGPARQAALSQVTGDYLWFVDPTDLLPHGALEAVNKHLAAARPQVLVVDHVVREVDGSERPVRPGRYGATPQLWDKVVEAGFLREHGGGLAAGAGWEARTTWPLLLAAGQVDVLGRAAYVRRALPEAVRRRAEVGTAAEAAREYGELLRDVTGPAEQGDERRLATLAALHAEALGRLDRLPAAARPAMFASLAAAWRDLGLQRDSRLRPAQRRALETGRYPAWRALQEAAAARRAARGRARRLVREVRSLRRLPRRARSWPRRAYYRAQLRRPLERDLVVYAAYWYTAYSCNPRAIYETARRLAPWLHGVWVVNPDKVAVVPAGVEHVVAGTREYYRVMARATYLVNNVNFPNDIVKRRGQVHLQTHHGTPLKTMGLDLVRAPYGRKRMNFHRLMKRVARWDFSISQNAFTTEQWERVYPGTYESLETGYPRNDVLATATPDDVARVRAELGIEPGKTAVLYTPTHREYHQGFVAQLDPEQLAKALGPDAVLLMRTHYFYRDGQDGAGPAPAGVVDVADHPRIEDLYLAADALVTDYSSVMFDYAVLDRPIVIYAPDWDEYRTLRGAYFDVVAEPPGPVVTTEADLAEVLATRRAWDDESTAQRQAFRARFCSLEDGRASERVVRRLWPAPDGGHA